MADHNSYIGVIDILVHDHMVAAICVSQVYKVFIVLAVMACQKTVWIELVEEVVTKNLLHLLLSCTWMETIGDDEENILLLNPYTVELVEDTAHGNLSVACRLATTLDDVRDDDGHLASLVCQFCNGRHTDRISDGIHGSFVEGIPILRKWVRILYCLTWNEYVRIIRELGSHCAFTILKIQFHLFSPRY